MSWLLYNQGMNDPPYPSVFVPNLSPVTAQRVIVVEVLPNPQTYKEQIHSFNPTSIVVIN